MRSIEEKMTSPLKEFLGADRVEDFKDKVCEIILAQITSDLENSGEYLVTTDDISEIVAEVFNDVKTEVKKKLMDRYMEIADGMISSLMEKGGSENGC